MAFSFLQNFLHTADKICAIEPNPENVRHVNSEKSKLIKFETAVSTAYGNINLYPSEYHDGSTLSSHHIRKLAMTSRKRRELIITRVSQLCRSLPCFLLIFDLEGSEAMKDEIVV